MLLNIFGSPDRVEKECSVLLESLEHIVHMEVGRHVTSYEVRSYHQIGRTNGLIAEAEVRSCETARLFRVVSEVSLAVFIGIIPDDLHRVFIGTYGTICTKTEELCFECSIRKDKVFVLRK